MPVILIYLLKVSIALSLFYLAYHFLLRRLTFYSLNRIYLLSSIVLSALFPILPKPFTFSKQEVISSPMIGMGESLAELPISTVSSFSLWDAIVVLYWSAVVLGVLLLFIRFFSLYRIHRHSPLEYWKGIKFYSLKSETPPFSFFKNIYLNPRLHSDKEMDTILKHEQVHTKNFHSFDALLAELMAIFLWFNPLSWRLKQAIKVNIEYIADHDVIQQGIGHATYQESLLHFAVRSTNVPLTNQFSFLSLKSRVIMMNKKQSSKKQLGKYVLVIPIITGSLFFFGVSKAYKREDAETATTVESVADFEPVNAEEVLSQLHASDSLTFQSPTNKGNVKWQTEKPLLIVDGKEEDKDVKELNSWLPAKDIARIEVLKEAAAIAVYGEKAKDGVIIIHTKKKAETLDNKGISQNEISDGKRNPTVSASIKNKEADGKQLIIRKKESIRVEEDGTTMIVGKADKATDERPLANELSAGGPFSTIKVTKGDSPSLYIVDGEESDASSITKISPDRIKSITVRKGEEAMGLYGSKAKSGVIEIQLK